MSCASTQMVSVWCGALVDGAGVVTQADDRAYTTQCWTYLWHTVRWCMMVDVRGYARGVCASRADDSQLLDQFFGHVPSIWPQGG
ncbi:UNVERIFIED_CONTAM: hypothetical protein Sradi_6695400 [Sesamum radiatum]|uniref:Uncharacterized protein n=1 Tax=Sesamum radiatum TaxID=300843 RepID=A0AAW2JQR3_SESRA